MVKSKSGEKLGAFTELAVQPHTTAREQMLNISTYIHNRMCDKMMPINEFANIVTLQQKDKIELH